MEITFIQGILLAIMATIVGLDFFLEAFFIFRPLMVSTFTGLILGDVISWFKGRRSYRACVCGIDSSRRHATT